MPSIDDITAMHDAMRLALVALVGDTTANGIRLLYGGSVKGSNATEIFAIENVDGGLVGGASLKAADLAQSSRLRVLPKPRSSRKSSPLQCQAAGQTP